MKLDDPLAVAALCARPKANVRHLLTVATVLSAMAAPVLAQSPSTEDTAANESLRQQERARILHEQQQRTRDVRRPAAAEVGLGRLPASESPCFTIERVELVGEMAQEFQWALQAADRADDGKADAAQSRCLGARSINIVMRRVQNAIMARGWITTRVLAEPQDLKGGTLRLTLMPGRVHDIRWAPNTDDRATRWNAVPVSSGQLLNLRDIEQALENFKRVPTAEADIQIVPSEAAHAHPDVRPGDSDLVIRWQQKRRVRTSVFLDDSGSKATGKYQGGLSVSCDHCSTLNDLFYVSLNHDLGGGDSGPRGSRAITAHYSVPMGYWLLALNASSTRFHQEVQGTSATYDYRGQSDSQDIKVSRLAYRDEVRKTSLALRGWRRSANNFLDDTEVQVQRRRMAGWELSVGHREFVGASTLDVNLALRRGTGALHALAAAEETTGGGTSRPEVVLADGQWMVPLTLGERRLRYSGNLRAQWSRTTLIAQDRFAIGGRYTVRGFDGNSFLSAEHGWLMRNELGWRWGTGEQELYAGIDHGAVRGASSLALPGTHLSGAVTGWRGSYGRLGWDVFVGVPLHKPEGFETASQAGGFSLHASF